MICPGCRNLVPATGPAVSYRAGEGVSVCIRYQCNICGRNTETDTVGSSDLAVFHRTALTVAARGGVA